MTKLDGFEKDNPREKLNDISRSFTSEIEGYLRDRDKPLKDIVRRIHHRVSNFSQCLESLLIESELRELHDSDTKTERP